MGRKVDVPERVPRQVGQVKPFSTNEHRTQVAVFAQTEDRQGQLPLWPRRYPISGFPCLLYFISGSQPIRPSLYDSNRLVESLILSES